MDKRSRAERRDSTRFNETIPMLLNNQEVRAFVFSADVGIGGVRFFQKVPLVIGDTYDLSIALGATKEWIHLRGKVAWQRTSGSDVEIGVMFTGVDPSDQEKLENYTKRIADERRRFPRVSKVLPIHVRGSGGNHSGVIVEISLGGARFLADRLIPKDESVEIEMKMDESDESKPMCIKARVVWSHHLESLPSSQPGVEYVHAVVFEEYLPQTLQQLEACVSREYSTKELNLVENLLHLIR